MKRLGFFLFAILVVISAAVMPGCSSGGDDVSIYQGTLSGTWQGSGMHGIFAVVIDADSIVTGNYSGGDSGSIIGKVDSSGSFSASATGLAGVASWTGSLQSIDGHASSGSGTWTAPGLSGTWSAP